MDRGELSLLVSQDRLSREGESLVKFPLLSSRAPNEVGVNINWTCSERQDFRWSATLYKQHAKKGNRTPHSSLSQLTCQEILGVLDTSRWREFDQTLSARESLARETISLSRLLNI